MKSVSFLLKFPETNDGKTDFADLLTVCVTLAEALVFPSEDNNYYPRQVKYDKDDNIINSLLEIKGSFKLESQDDFDLLFNILNVKKENVLSGSYGYIRYHECKHPGGPCPLSTIDTWGEEPEL